MFLGRELGGRPAEREFYADGVADYEKMAQAPAFVAGWSASSRARNPIGSR